MDDHNGGLEWSIPVAGLGVTALVLMFAAYSKIQAKLKPADIFSMIIAAGDAFTDIAFTVQQLRVMNSAFQYVIGFLLLIFLVLPTACSLYEIMLALHSPLLDARRMQDLAPYYAVVLFIALTNMEVLRVLPWQEGTATFDGLPDKRMMVRVWLVVMLLEDIPQFCIQLVALLSEGGAGMLALLSLGFTLAAVIWRGLRLPACSKGTPPPAPWAAGAVTTCMRAFANGRQGNLPSSCRVVARGRARTGWAGAQGCTGAKQAPDAS